LTVEASPKSRSIPRVKEISVAAGHRKRATSSAYSQILIGHRDKGCRRLASESLVTIQFSTSITRMKSIGERESSVLNKIPRNTIKKNLGR
jgi:hypothetical protein